MIYLAWTYDRGEITCDKSGEIDSLHVSDWGVGHDYE